MNAGAATKVRGLTLLRGLTALLVTAQR